MATVGSMQCGWWSEVYGLIETLPVLHVLHLVPVSKCLVDRLGTASGIWDHVEVRVCGWVGVVMEVDVGWVTGKCHLVKAALTKTWCDDLCHLERLGHANLATLTATHGPCRMGKV